MNSQITLEDIFVKSTKPDADAVKAFKKEATVIVKTQIGVTQSECCQCNLQFDRTRNEATSCQFHPGSFKLTPNDQICRWTCCNAMREKSPGCLRRPHSGMERAVAVRMDASPRTIEGLTMYKHIEANLFAGVPHTIIIQMTKGLTSSFASYFLGDGKNVQFEPEESTVSHHQRKRANTDSTSDAFDSSGFDNDDSSNSSSWTSISDNHQDGGGTKKNLLLGGGLTLNTRRRTKSLSKKKKKDQQIIEKAPPKDDKRSATEDSEKIQEIVFVKYWRVGDININFSITGFQGIIQVVNMSNQKVLVPSFSKAYKIGTSRYLVMKLVKHLVVPLATNFGDIIKNKIHIGGKNQDNTGSLLSDVIEGKEGEEDDASSRKNEGDEADAFLKKKLLFPYAPFMNKKKKSKSAFKNKIGGKNQGITGSLQFDVTEGNEGEADDKHGAKEQLLHPSPSVMRRKTASRVRNRTYTR